MTKKVVALGATSHAQYRGADKVVKDYPVATAKRCIRFTWGEGGFGVSALTERSPSRVPAAAVSLTAGGVTRAA